MWTDKPVEQREGTLEPGTRSLLSNQNVKASAVPLVLLLFFKKKKKKKKKNFWAKPDLPFEIKHWQA